MSTELTTRLAKKIILRLRAGTSPLEGVPFLNVGRERYYSEVGRLLEDIADGGASSVRFLNADYGHGKTHFIGMINHLALSRGWVTSYVKLSVSENIRLDRFQSLYGAILRNCVCGRLLEAYENSYDPGDANGWTWIIDDWIKRHLETERRSGIDPQSVGARQRTLSALDLLLRKANVVGDFAAAIRTFATSSFDRADDQSRRLCEAVARWFACEKMAELRSHGVIAPIDDKNARQVLRNVIALLRGFGYKGMAIFIDEAENVLTRGYTKTQRQVAYQNLRELLDNIDGGVSGVGLGQTLCYLASTPVMFSGEKGFREYPALQDRIEDVRIPIRGFEGLVDYRAIVVDLSASTLTAANRREIARKIRAIHGVAFGWEPSRVIPDEWLDRIVAECEKRSGELGGLRPLCRSISTALELAQQYPDRIAELDGARIVSDSLDAEVLR